MKVEDFRIGNYIVDYELDPEISVYWKVSEISYMDTNYKSRDTLGVLYRNGSCWNSDPIPVQLTEEILLLCGFDLIGECFFISKLPSIFLKKPFIGADYLLVKSDGGDQLTSIRYLHQLQNLYYCLCGEELNVKL